MELDQQNQDIIQLLTKLKDADNTYPEHMLVARRRSFLKQMTEVGLGASTVKGGQHAGARTKPSPTSSMTSTLLETALIAAIVMEISAMAYFYRDKLAGFFQDITATSGIQNVTPPPVILTSQEINPSPATTSTSSSVTVTTDPIDVTVTLTSTSVPDDIQGINQINSTPDPNGNNGNHYGQTPKPERTKENNGGNGGNGGNGNNGDKDKDPKPTKDK